MYVDFVELQHRVGNSWLRHVRIEQYGDEHLCLQGIDMKGRALQRQLLEIHPKDAETLGRALIYYAAGPLGKLVLDAEAPTTGVK